LEVVALLLEVAKCYEGSMNAGKLLIDQMKRHSLGCRRAAFQPWTGTAPTEHQRCGAIPTLCSAPAIEGYGGLTLNLAELEKLCTWLQ
jgi:hypothetical protein